MRNKKIIPVTENKKQIMLETNAPIDTIITTFHIAHNRDEFVKLLQLRGYLVESATYVTELDFDKKNKPTQKRGNQS